jgi:CDGSH-type Zn-finger protein
MSDEHLHTLVTVRATSPSRGPYRIDGDWTIVDIDGNAVPLPAERKDLRRISLCGCGMSATWPICDGTHKTLVAGG